MATNVRHCFIGVGRMAQAMVKRLLEEAELEKPVILWNRTPAAAESCRKAVEHAEVAASPSEAVARSDIVWSCLKDGEAVEQTFQQIWGLDIKGKLFVECSTVAQDTADRISRKCFDAGAEYVAMPVFGNPGMAAKGELICVVSGLPSSIDRLRPFVVGVLGQSLIDLSGEEPRKAVLLKLIGNLLLLTTMETCAEALVFAERSGVGVDSMQKLLNAMFPLKPHRLYSEKMSSGAYCNDKVDVELSAARKLADSVLSVASTCGACVKGYEVAVNHLKAAESCMGPNADITALYGAVRKESGLPAQSRKRKRDDDLDLNPQRSPSRFQRM